MQTLFPTRGGVLVMMDNVVKTDQGHAKPIEIKSCIWDAALDTGMATIAVPWCHSQTIRSKSDGAAGTGASTLIAAKRCCSLEV